MNEVAYRSLTLFAHVMPNRVWMWLPYRVRSWWAGEWVIREIQAGR